MARTWKIHPKHRKKGTLDIRKTKICITCNKNKTSKYHHFECENCANKRYKNFKHKVKWKQ